MRYVILGASAAGINCAKTLRLEDKDCEIIIISKDLNVYSRCMLHHFISGHRNIEELDFIGKDFFEKYNITWIKGKTVHKLDTTDKYVEIDNEMISYDKILIATGASSFIPPIKNLRETVGVYSLRNIEDAISIREKLNEVKEIVVLGAGLVGIDAVVGLIDKDIKISLVELSDRILPSQLDKESALRYENMFKKKDVDIFTGVKAEEIISDGAGQVKSLKLSNNKEISCQMIIVATGVRSNINFIAQDTIKVDRGIIIDNTCATNVPDAYAAGDVCAVSPIWPLAVKQGITAAYNMMGIKKQITDSFGLRNTLNFLNLQTVSLGLIEVPDESYNTYVRKDNKDYKKIIEKGGIIYGALLQGDISYCGTLTYLIKNRINIKNINKDIFDINYSDFYSVKENGEYAFAI